MTFKFYADEHDQALSTFHLISINDYLIEPQTYNEDVHSCTCTASECCATSTCINRQLFIECIHCHSDCRNQRFQHKEYPSIRIRKTENKGFGLFTQQLLKKGDFVIEYVGQVISYSMFKQRAQEYENNTHFYFMSLSAIEIIDATQKGNVARFMNHSCKPNCVLEKWIVKGKMRIGMFACRDIAEDEELNFDYKFERYGEKDQICYCGEVECKGTIGGKKREFEDAFEKNGEGKIVQVRREKVISQTTAEPLKNVEEVDVLVHGLAHACTANQIKRYVEQLDATEDLDLLKKFVAMQGLLSFKFILRIVRHDLFICTKIFRILNRLPLTNRYAVEETGLEVMVQRFTQHLDTFISETAGKLLEEWSGLQGYKIPKKIVMTQEQPTEIVKKESIKGSENFKEMPSSPASRLGSPSVNRFSRPMYDNTKRRREDSNPASKLSRDAPEESFGNDRFGNILLIRRNSNVSFSESQAEVKSETSISIEGARLNCSLEEIVKNATKFVEEKQLQEQKGAESDTAPDSSPDYGRRRKTLSKNGSKSAALKEGKRKDGVSHADHSEEKLSEEERTFLRLQREKISQTVCKYMSKYREKMAPGEFKDWARKATHSIMDKELWSESNGMRVIRRREMNDAFKEKIQDFVKKYVSAKLQKKKRQSKSQIQQ